jgi:hypothetical protein
MPHISDEDVIAGSFGESFDAHIGKCPRDGPLGYTLRKLVTRTPSTSAKHKVATVRPDPLYEGFVFTDDNTAGATPARTILYEGFTGTQTPSTDKKIAGGDIVIGTILRAVDTRPDDTRDGSFTLGLVKSSSNNANVLSDKTAYGGLIDPGQTASKITSDGLVGTRSVAAMKSTVAVGLISSLYALPRVQRGFTGAGESNPPFANLRMQTAFTDSGGTGSTGSSNFADVFGFSNEPILAIDHVSAAASSVDFEITQYVLMGPRQSEVSTTSLSDETFSLAELLSCNKAFVVA